MQKLIEFISKDWNEFALIIVYKRAKLKILVDTLPDHLQEQLKLHDPKYFNISGHAYLDKYEIDPESVTLSFNSYGIPIHLKSYVIQPTEYVIYKYKHEYGMREIHIQKNGFLVYCAPTGQGKTFFALSNLENLSKQFDTILYVNFELSIDDIKNRCIEMQIDIPDNLYIAPLESVEAIQDWSQERGSCLYIIDNIDNLVGGGSDPYGLQLEFIKHLDRYLKDFNHHALVLTQLVKENSINLIDKDGQINGSITTNVLSGVKQLSYLSRSVMMTAYSPEIQTYVYKILKVGSAKNYE